ncbi:hypothetical protein LCL96_01220 [Rossellomorea aquimaris]|uniref:hypothetical protein n=1 Tax=Rossellomorea aquimaris TaxID=189382 RepID=UPI001CD6E1C9|nr:hypothetical protein [Rossellomorea aquimaris]MCA1057536.1 hypothetical protein [Rossellomorea aquimaris]
MRKYLGWAPIGMIGVTFILLLLLKGKVSWYVDTTVLITGIVLALVTALLIKNGKPKAILISVFGILVGGFLMLIWGFIMEGGL